MAASSQAEQALRQLGQLGQSASGIFGHVGMAVQSATQVIQETAMKACSCCGQSNLRATMTECQECKGGCCRQCAVTFSLLGVSATKRQFTVCRGCEPALKRRCTEDNVRHRLQRVEAFLQHRLEPYVYDPESKLDKTLRLSSHVMTGLKQVSSFIPLGQAAQAVKAGYYLVRYGPMMLAGNDILEAFQLILGLARKLETNSRQIMSSDFFGGLYYTMGEHWGQRGRAPELEALEHSEGGRIPRPDRELLLRLRHVFRLLHISTESSATDAQRLLRQAMPGAELIQAELSTAVTIPSYFLVASRSTKAAYLVLPGTRNPSDLATDFNADEEEIGGGTGHKGMVASARWLNEEVSPLLIRLYTDGYRITVVGHSLGAGVGAFLTLMLRRHIGSIFCYGFGTPSCIDEKLQPALLDCMVSVVNRDDMVPRLSIRSVQELVDSVLCPGQVAKTQAWMKEDWQAIKDVERVVALRRRQDPFSSAANGPRAAEASSIEICQEVLSDEEEAKVVVLVEAGVERDVAIRALRDEGGDLNSALLKATEVESQRPVPMQIEAAVTTPSAPSAPSAGPASALLGGLLRNIPWASSASSSEGPQERITLGPSDSQALAERSTPMAVCRRANHPQFLVPGQVVHLYHENGLSRAALAAASHPSLGRIIPSQNMLQDHHVSAYAEALHQACIENPKTQRWESFDERKVCACCGSDFSWAYILQSEAQKMLARHNCYVCGHVVCEGCSRKRFAHAHLGFPRPVRTCDSCFFSQYEGTDDAQVALASEEAAAVGAGIASAASASHCR